MARHGDIGCVTVHAGRGQHVGAVHGHALRLVDRGGVAVVEVRLVLQIEGDAASVLQPDGQALGRSLLQHAERAVLHAQRTLVSQDMTRSPGRASVCGRPSRCKRNLRWAGRVVEVLPCVRPVGAAVHKPLGYMEFAERAQFAFARCDAPGRSLVFPAPSHRLLRQTSLLTFSYIPTASDLGGHHAASARAL